MFSHVIKCLRNAGALLLSKEFEANAKMGHGKPATLGPSSTSAHGCPTSTNINPYQPINLSRPRRAGRLPRRPSVASMRTEAARCHRSCHVPRYPRYNDKKCLERNMGMDQYLLIPVLMGWTSIYQLFWCELQGYKVLTHCHMSLLNPWFPTCLMIPVDLSPTILHIKIVSQNSS